MFFSFSCSKQVKIEEQPVAPLSATDREFIKRYRALNRPAVSAGFNIYSLMGSFKGELYLEPGDKTLSLVYGYMPLGKSLFEFKLSGRDYLYLDLSNSYAYSNQKDWLSDFVETSTSAKATADKSSDKKDYAVDAGLDDQDQMALMLISALQALAGDIPEPSSVSVSGQKSEVLVSDPAADYSIKYYFDSDPLRLMKMEIKKQKSAMSLEFEYTAVQWFPESIKLNSDRVSALVKMEKITCPESSRPKINFEIPSGFVNILLTGR